ncbi:hypothetical protein PILCRDRAFT_171722 [Piloderma croceum F 1598]|uniref:Uncharacterized protein n=1 Tax=Piloderma croceum (strain F 1598) TaxID=765440 RepID=A0A0C3G1E9_PILCF|nr:hypothetical protein PILCRDRAFT_171722 [Piloderma croceum F 1598]
MTIDKPQFVKHNGFTMAIAADPKLLHHSQHCPYNQESLRVALEQSTDSEELRGHGFDRAQTSTEIMQRRFGYTARRKVWGSDWILMGGVVSGLHQGCMLQRISLSIDGFFPSTFATPHERVGPLTSKLPLHPTGNKPTFVSQ